MASQKRDLTQGSVRKQLLLFAMPFLLTNMLQTMYNLADTWILSQFIGKFAVSAANSGGQVLNVAINIIIGLAVGGTVVIGQLSGSKDADGIRRTVGTFLTLMSFVGLVFTVVFAANARRFLIMINTPPQVLDDAVDFLLIYCVGVIFMFGNNAVAAVCRGVGDSKAPLMFMIASSALNVILDLLAIFVMGWRDIRVTAWTTVIAIVFSFILSVGYLLQQRDLFRLSLRTFKPDWALLWRVLKVGVPSAVQSSIFGMSVLLVTALINKYGVDASAAAGLGSRVDSVILMPLNALSAATSAMIAQNLGARKVDRVRSTLKNALLFGYIFAFAAFAAAQTVPQFFFGFLTSDPESIAIGALYLRWASYNYLLVTGLSMFNAVAIGSGNTVYPLCATIMNGFVFRVPIAVFFEQVLGFGLAGVFMGLGFANIGGIIAGFIYYRLGYWARPKKTPVSEEQLAALADTGGEM